MAHSGLDSRVKSLEETARALRAVPERLDLIEGRLAGVELQVLRTREDLERAIYAIAQDLRAEIRASADALREELRTEIRASADALREELRAEIRASAEELRRHMGVLAEDTLAQMRAMLDEFRIAPRKRPRR